RFSCSVHHSFTEWITGLQGTHVHMSLRITIRVEDTTRDHAGGDHRQHHPLHLLARGERDRRSGSRRTSLTIFAPHVTGVIRKHAIGSGWYVTDREPTVIACFRSDGIVERTADAGQ